MIDKTLLDEYDKEKLWDQDGFYYTLLEHAIYETATGRVDRDCLTRILIQAEARKSRILQRSFDDKGQVFITITKIPLWRRLWLKIRRK